MKVAKHSLVLLSIFVYLTGCGGGGGGGNPPVPPITNKAPVIVQGAGPLTVTMDEDSSPTAWTAPTLSATDADTADTLTWSVSVNPVSGLASVSGTGDAPSIFSYSPDPDFNGVDSFTVEVSDGKATDTIVVEVTVTAQIDLITAVFMAPPVGGVDYACSGGTSGTTNAAGEFTCYDNEVVSFSLGGYPLGEVAVAPLVTLFSLTGASQPTLRQLDGFTRGQMNSVSDLPVHHALNVALLLQTLDDDGDFTGGINIATADALALSKATYTLNLNRKSTTVLGRLRKVLKQAELVRNPQSLMGTIRHLIQSGVVTTPLYRLTEEERDIGGEGTPDERYAFSWDANGDAVTFTKDSGADGSIEVTITNTYFATHNLNIQEIDNPSVYPLGYLAGHTYDADGNLTLEQVDSPVGVTLDAIYTSTYDGFGNKTLYEIDSDADLVVDATHTSTYDADGNLTSYEEDYNLTDANPDLVIAYTYDADGNLTKEERDLDADANIDATHTSTYDGSGVLTSYRIDDDRDGDGIIDPITDTYNSDGNLILTVKDASSPVFYSTVEYGYDTRGNRSWKDYTSSAGTTWKETYSYDGEDNLIYSDRDNNADATIDLIWTWTYTNGVETRFERYTGAGTTPNSIITHTYEPAAIYPDRSNFPGF